MSIISPLNIAIVGYGYWGPNLLRNFRESPLFSVMYLVELNEELRTNFQFSNLGIQVTDSLETVLEDKNIHCVAIATPPQTHFAIAKKCLEKGKHIFIEKPFTSSFEDAKSLVSIAAACNLKIMVDFTFLYNGSITCIKEIIENQDKFGKILYVDSVRINLGIFQNDVNVVWDLACHDISIFNYLFNDLPHSVQAIGIDSLNTGLENIAYIHLKYQDKFAHINCSWSSPVKIRKMLIGADRQAILYNDIEPTDKVKIYNKGVLLDKEAERNSLLQDYRMGEVYIPKYDTTEALRNVTEAFYKLINKNETSNSNGNDALIVLFILEMIQKSILLKGKEIAIDWKQVGPSLFSYITSKGMLSEPLKE
jgi:predicted dehydrogenase